MLRAAALLIAAALLSPCASALSACRAAVLDADTGEVCFARNASEHALIASTTKIMTGLLIAEDCDPDAVVTVPQEAVGIEGSSLYLKAGEQLTVRALLYGLLLHSGNDAAVALALAHSGSVGAFVEAMNGRARELGLRDTHFTNPNGLDAPEHYSTALDLARLTLAALQVPAFAEVVATRQITIEGRSFTNHNRLLWSLDGAIGVKTGFTRAAGRTLVSAVERNGRRLIAVTLCAPDDWQDHACLYDEAFAAFSEREAVKAGACVASVPLLSGGSAELMAGESVTYALRDGETVTVRPLWPRVAFSAGTPGEPAGEGAYFSGRAASRASRCSGESVPMRERIQKILSARGVASRRAAEELIRQGRVTVDGVPCALGALAEPDCRTIAVDGVPIPPPPEHVYLMLYKPRGYITTLSDERGRRTAASLVDCGTRVYPVGRLDYDSEGLLLFTNDGALADRLMHPRREISKVYEVTARGPLDGVAERLRRPLVLDGYRIRPPEVEQTAPGRFLITIHEGRNRQIRRMCAAAGLEVLRLRRIAEGPLQLGTLAPGAWRPLTEAELAALRQETEGGDPV